MNLETRDNSEFLQKLFMERPMTMLHIPTHPPDRSADVPTAKPPTQLHINILTRCPLRNTTWKRDANCCSWNQFQESHPRSLRRHKSLVKNNNSDYLPLSIEKAEGDVKGVSEIHVKRWLLMGQHTEDSSTSYIFHHTCCRFHILAQLRIRTSYKFIQEDCWCWLSSHLVVNNTQS